MHNRGAALILHLFSQHSLNIDVKSFKYPTGLWFVVSSHVMCVCGCGCVWVVARRGGVCHDVSRLDDQADIEK